MCSTCRSSVDGDGLRANETILPKSAESERATSNRDNEQIEGMTPSPALRSGDNGEQQRETTLQVASISEEDSTPTDDTAELSGDGVAVTPSIPEQVSSSNGTVLFDVKMFVRRPSPYQPSDPRFHQVRVRRFVGAQETPFSLYEDCVASLPLSHAGFIFNGDAIEVTIVSVTT